MAMFSPEQGLGSGVDKGVDGEAGGPPPGTPEAVEKQSERPGLIDDKITELTGLADRLADLSESKEFFGKRGNPQSRTENFDTVEVSLAPERIRFKGKLQLVVRDVSGALDSSPQHEGLLEALGGVQTNGEQLLDSHRAALGEDGKALPITTEGAVSDDAWGSLELKAITKFSFENDKIRLIVEYDLKVAAGGELPEAAKALLAHLDSFPVSGSSGISPLQKALNILGNYLDFEVEPDSSAIPPVEYREPAREPEAASEPVAGGPAVCGEYSAPKESVNKNFTQEQLEYIASIPSLPYDNNHGGYVADPGDLDRLGFKLETRVLLRKGHGERILTKEINRRGREVVTDDSDTVWRISRKIGTSDAGLRWIFQSKRSVFEAAQKIQPRRRRR